MKPYFGSSRRVTNSYVGGCYYTKWEANSPYNQYQTPQRSYLPLHSMRSHTTIKDIASRTVLTQTFSNNSNEHLENIAYSFPLYDGVSVVSFTATIGDVRIRGIVKEKQQARRDYNEAISKGSAAGLLEQLPESSDVFITSIGNVPAKAKVIVNIEYIGELKHDAEANGVRFTIPSSIAPRYGTTPGDVVASSALINPTGAIQVTVDFQSPEGCPIQQIQSPSHPVTVTVGRTSAMSTNDYMPNCGSATLSLDATSLDKDFIFIASIRDADKPKALLETHPSVADQRALMVTLVPRFNLAPSYGEIVFIVDRSGSMGGKIPSKLLSSPCCFLLSGSSSSSRNIALPLGHHFLLILYFQWLPVQWQSCLNLSPSESSSTSAHSEANIHFCGQRAGHTTTRT